MDPILTGGGAGALINAAQDRTIGLRFFRQAGNAKATGKIPDICPFHAADAKSSRAVK
jgi:hypothetical protein